VRLCCSAAWWRRPPQQPTFSAKREAVRVDALVTDGGKVVPGLGAPDFEVRDNGVLQTSTLVSFQQIPLNVFLALDTSASVSANGWCICRLPVMRCSGVLARTNRSALLTFSHVIQLREGLTSATAACVTPSRASSHWAIPRSLMVRMQA
jgi:hypothetical protein